MKIKTISISLFLILFVSCNSKIPLEKPLVAKIDPVEDTYFGKTLTDDYRYLEDLKDSTVIDWFRSQADYTKKILESIPGRQKLIDKMYAFDERRSSWVTNLSITDNDRYFYLKYTPEDDTGKLYYRDGYEGEEIFLYDPLTFSDDSTKKYVIDGVSPNKDGSTVAFGVAEGGSEVNTTVIINVEDKKLYPEQIENCFPYYSWLPDGNGFTYLQENSGDIRDLNKAIDNKSKLHYLGEDIENDRVLLSRPKYPQLGIKPEEVPYVMYDHDSDYIFGYAITVDRNLKVYFADGSAITNDEIPWKHFIQLEDNIYDFYADKEYAYLLTPKDAPNFKILKMRLDNPDVSEAEVVVAEDPLGTIKSFSLTKDGLYYTLSFNGVQEKFYYLGNDSESSIEIELPFTAGDAQLRTKGPRFSDVWISIAGWTSDSQRYRYITDSKEFKLENLSDKPDYPEYKNLVAEEIMIESHDGIMVPLSLVYNKQIKKNGKTPVLFFGYGSYGYSMNPFFWSNGYQWISEGGIFAVAHVRGGGELGEQWHKDGQITTKPNTWKDLIACTEYMIKEGYTNPEKVAIYSGSAGGILVGRAMTERPDLFGAVIPDVGEMNTVRSEMAPYGPMNVPEFGTVEDSVQCMALIEMDSYHHLEKGAEYPATLITAGMNDPRVIAWQPGKFAARLQDYNTSDNPILFWADFEAGHGIGNTKSKRFESLANILSFALWQTGNKKFKPTVEF